jgi:2-hydroxy-6-oxonona-2,4-dienedioate hydrolase
LLSEHDLFRKPASTFRDHALKRGSSVADTDVLDKLADPAEAVATISGRARRVETLCGDGTMVWRIWGQGPAILLLHGGHGAWSHWIRNVMPLSARHTVVAVDMPGFAESASPPQPYTADSLAEIVARGLGHVLDREIKQDKIAIVGFSFGGVIGGHVANEASARVSRLVLVGSGGMALPRPKLGDMKNWKRMESEDERREAHRSNLATLMLRDAKNIDALALHLQSTNTVRTRINSRAISLTDSLRRRLSEIATPLDGIWGTHDATVGEFIDLREALLRELDPGSTFRRVEGGHWIQYEAPDAFNTALLGLLAKERSARGK